MQKRPGLSILKTLWVIWILLDLFLIFSARPFPSEDGPLHLYYVEVIRALFAHQPDLHQFFALKSIPSPYLFQYASLLLLERFVDALTAEQILLAFYVLWFSFAVYYLARSLGPNWIYACLAAMPLTMNLTLYLGFVNFTSSVATCLLLIGFWIRHSSRWTAKSILIFIALFLLMISMHPVPVMVFALYLGLDAAVHFVSRMRESGATFGSTLRPFLLSERILLLPGIILAVWAAWVLLLMKTYPPGTWPSHETSLPNRIKEALFLYALLPLGNRGFRYPVLLFFLTVLGFVAWTFWRNGRPLAAKPGVLPVLLLGILCCCAYCVVPEAAAGSAYFSIRFILVGALLLLVPAACLPARLPSSLALALLGTLVAVNSTVELLAVHKEVARAVRPLLTAPIHVRGEGALITPLPVSACRNCNFNPYEYSAVNYLRRSDSVFLNSIWTTLPIIPLQVREHHAWDDETSAEMVKTLSNAGLAQTSMPLPDFLILSQSQDAAPALPSRIEELFSANPAALDSEHFVLYVRKDQERGASSPPPER